MKPVLVLQHLSVDGPAFLATWLQAEGQAFELRNTEAGQDYPASIDGYGALAVLGGEMSANDELPSLRRAEQLIREAMAKDVPVIGHCLGGQLMARALGVPIVASKAPEIGWQAIDVHDTPAARRWFGASGATTVFQWHAEAFGLPPGAEPLAGSPACTHQACAIGRHLAMQFHVELDAAKLAVWSRSRDPAFLRWQHEHASVQGGEAMRAQAGQALPAQQRLAARLYRRWLSGR